MQRLKTVFLYDTIPEAIVHMAQANFRNFIDLLLARNTPITVTYDGQAFDIDYDLQFVSPRLNIFYIHVGFANRRTWKAIRFAPRNRVTLRDLRGSHVLEAEDIFY